MMQDKIILLSPAKINLFLRVLNKRNDGFHNIRSGITFINLFDEVSIEKTNLTNIIYSGIFKPANGYYKNCIIRKTLNLLNLNEEINLKIKIKKNIPTLSGLGSASTNAAAIINGLKELNIININTDKKFYSTLGSDVPFFLHGKDAIVSGKGDVIKNFTFPKYFFLLVKPKLNLSTKKMYEKIIPNSNNADENVNDFERLFMKNNNIIFQLLRFLSKTEKCIFARMTGSGSCCFAAYEKERYAKKGYQNLKEKFPDLWSFIGENNVINN